jgi:protein tyrosine/serine phosphatase
MIVPAFAKKDRKRNAARGAAAVTIDNFGQVNDHIYRGGQPKGVHYRQLVVLGIKTVLDLRGDAEPDSKTDAEQAGLQYINLPLEPKRYPQAYAATRFLEIVNEQANWPVFVHCAGGRHRTGAMIAVYRMAMDHWTVDQAYKEMKQYDFYTFGGHGCFKEYVYDYSRNKQFDVASESQTEKKAPEDSGPPLMGLPIKLTKRVVTAGKNITTLGKDRKSQ